VQAYFDGELDAIAASAIEAHLATCAECASMLESYRKIRAGIRRELPMQSVSPAVYDRIGLALDAEQQPRKQPLKSSWWRSNRDRSFWRGATAGAGGVALAAAMTFYFVAPALDNRTVDELTAAHVRSLMPSHLMDVESTDQHTVKPWFAGHADVSPAVADFAQSGFPLAGGRVDYIDHQRAAVLVYRHGPHVINVFTLRSTDRPLPASTARSGYRLIAWREGDLSYIAVSDAGKDELISLERLLQGLRTP
jgi:anti-sigma factor RsiW